MLSLHALFTPWLSCTVLQPIIVSLSRHGCLRVTLLWACSVRWRLLWWVAASLCSRLILLAVQTKNQTLKFTKGSISISRQCTRASVCHFMRLPSVFSLLPWSLSISTSNGRSNIQEQKLNSMLLQLQILILLSSLSTCWCSALVTLSLSTLKFRQFFRSICKTEMNQNSLGKQEKFLTIFDHNLRQMFFSSQMSIRVLRLLLLRFVVILGQGGKFWLSGLRSSNLQRTRSSSSRSSFRGLARCLLLIWLCFSQLHFMRLDCLVIRVRLKLDLATMTISVFLSRFCSLVRQSVASHFSATCFLLALQWLRWGQIRILSSVPGTLSLPCLIIMRFRFRSCSRTMWSSNLIVALLSRLTSRTLILLTLLASHASWALMTRLTILRHRQPFLRHSSLLSRFWGVSWLLLHGRPSIRVSTSVTFWMTDMSCSHITSYSCSFRLWLLVTMVLMVALFIQEWFLTLQCKTWFVMFLIVLGEAMMFQFSSYWWFTIQERLSLNRWGFLCSSITPSCSLKSFSKCWLVPAKPLHGRYLQSRSRKELISSLFS